MTHPRMRVPSPALILACVALFAASGGGAYAVSSAPAGISFTDAKLKHGWTVYNPSLWGTPAYAKDSLGVVHLRGAMQAGSGDDAFVLPKGLRPVHSLVFSVGNTSTTGVEQLVIYSSGKVVPGVNGTAVFLDGVNFPTSS
jgi:hypothetical protein